MPKTKILYLLSCSILFQTVQRFLSQTGRCGFSVNLCDLVSAAAQTPLLNRKTMWQSSSILDNNVYSEIFHSFHEMLNNLFPSSHICTRLFAWLESSSAPLSNILQTIYVALSASRPQAMSEYLADTCTCMSCELFMLGHNFSPINSPVILVLLRHKAGQHPLHPEARGTSIVL